MDISGPSKDQWPDLLAAHESMKQPKLHVPTGGGHGGVVPPRSRVAATANTGGCCQPQSSPVNRQSFASVVKPTVSFRFPPIQLPARQQATKDGKPMVAFTPSEIQPGIQRLQHSLIAKFSSGRPTIDVVRRHLSEAWGLEDKSTIGAMDARHILIFLPSANESNRTLAHPLRKVCQSLFRLFRWSPDFHRRKEPTTITTWIKLPGLPSHLFDQGYISPIISTFGRFIAIDEKTRMLSNPSFARACVELDLSKPFPEEVWVSLGPDNGFWQPITYENKLLYCSKCKFHGHELSTCRRNKPSSTARETAAACNLQEDNQPNVHQAMPNRQKSASTLSKEWTMVTKKKKKGSVDNTSDPSTHDIQNSPAIISEVQPKAGDDDHIDITSAMVVYQDQLNNSNEDLQSLEVPLPEEIVQKISSYGSELFYYEKDGDPIEARAFYLRFRAAYGDDALFFQAMDKAVNAARQTQKEGSGIPIEESDSSVDLSLLLKKPRRNKKGSRFSARSRPKKKDTNFVW